MNDLLYHNEQVYLLYQSYQVLNADYFYFSLKNKIVNFLMEYVIHSKPNFAVY